jgi:hypothetical protein
MVWGTGQPVMEFEEEYTRIRMQGLRRPCA